MSQELACWVCGRTLNDINNTLGAESEDEAWFNGEIAAVERARATLAENVTSWKKDLPEQFKDFELSAILQSADQFRSIKFLGQLVESGRGIIRELDEVSYRVRKGDTATIGNATTDKLEKLVVQRLDAFEKKTNRRLKREDDMHNWNYQRLGYIDRLKGLKFLDGIDYIAEAGAFDYGLQLELLEKGRAEARERRPVWKVGVVKFSNFPKEIPLCNICEKLMHDSQPVQYPENKETAKK